MSNVETVQQIYEAFGRGDVPSILSHLATDVQWEQWLGGNSAADAGVPYLVPRQGRDDVAGFFAALQALEFHTFEPYALLEGDRRVAALIRAELEVKATGKRFLDDEVHVWVFGPDGNVNSFRHFVDTAKHLAEAS